MSRILVIDDEESIRSIMRRVLERVGHEVVEAANGAIGTQLFEESPFDLVITDLLMPEKEGIETILDLRSRFPDVKILVVSGGLSYGGRIVDERGPLGDAEALGADASLKKPFQFDEFIELVGSLLSTP